MDCSGYGHGLGSNHREDWPALLRGLLIDDVTPVIRDMPSYPTEYDNLSLEELEELEEVA